MTISSDVIKGMGLSLEQEAYKQFGNAVENQVDGLLGKVLGQYKPGAVTDPNSAAYAAAQFAPGIAGKEPGIWSPTKYAAGIIDNYYPKNKFLFRVKLVFRTEILEKLASLGLDSLQSQEITYTVKSIDLPTITFQYQEVNMYNFKTKILTGIEHQDLQLALYDDSANVAIASVMAYLQLLSPITRNQYKTRNPRFFEDGAMNFDNNYSPADKTGSRDILPGNIVDPLDHLLVEQYFAPSVSSNAAALKVNTFTFTNPKITRFDISDQNYEDGATANIVTIAFNYDAINMTTKTDLNSLNETDIGPGNPVGDLFGAATDTQYSGKYGQINRHAAGGVKNPFVQIIQNQGRRAADNAIRNVLNKQFGTLAGGALGGVISKVGGAVGDAAGRTLKGASENVIQNVARETSAPVKDNAEINKQIMDSMK